MFTKSTFECSLIKFCKDFEVGRSASGIYELLIKTPMVQCSNDPQYDHILRITSDINLTCLSSFASFACSNPRLKHPPVFVRVMDSTCIMSL
jgi:hypothetical protein